MVTKRANRSSLDKLRLPVDVTN